MSNGPEADARAQIESDIRLVIGGGFSPDSIGQDKHDAVLARVRAKAGAYLDAFERMYLGENFDAMAQSHLFIPDLLMILREREPDRVRATAARLIKQYDAVLVVHDAAADRKSLASVLPEATMRLVDRLNKCRVRLRPLAE